MTAWALMTAASAVDGGPEARTVHHRILYNIQYSNHYSLFTFHFSLLTKKVLCAVVDVCHAIVEFRQLAAVPAVSSAHQIARDTL